MLVHWNKWAGEICLEWVFTKAQAVLGGCLGCQPCHSFALGTVLSFLLLHRGTPFSFILKKIIELKYVKFPGVLIVFFVWFCFMGLFSPPKILLAFIVNQSLFLERTDFPVECKVLATHDLLYWPWLLSPSLHLETSSQFVALRAESKEVTIKTYRNKYLHRQHCQGGSVIMAVAGFAYPLAVVSWDLHSQQLRIYIFVMAALWDLHEILKSQQHRILTAPQSSETPHVSHWISNRPELLQGQCQSVLNTSHISTRKVRNEILAQMKVLRALALPSGKAEFTTCSHLTLTYPQWALLDLLQFLLNCHLTGSQGRKENRWEKFLMHMDWYLRQSLCPGMGVLLAESPIPVWEAGSSLPEETCLVLQGEVTSLPSHLFWKHLIWNELTLQWVPGAVVPVLPLLSERHQAEDAAAQF